MKNYMLLILLSIVSFSIQAQGSLEGILKKTDGNPLEFANVTLKQNGEFIKGVSANMEGYYFIDNLKEGEYELTFSYMTSISTPQTIKIVARETFAFNSSIEIGFEFKTVVITAPDITLFDRSKPDVNVIGIADIKERKATTMNEMIITEAKTTKNADGEISFGGGRPGSAVYYIDGISYDHSYIPMSAIKTMHVYSGSIPAKFGNTTSAVIDIQTRSFFD